MRPLCRRTVHSGHNQGYQSEWHSLRLHMLRGDRMFDLQKEIRGHIFPKTGDPLQGSPVFVFAATAAPGQKFRQFPRQNPQRIPV